MFACVGGAGVRVSMGTEGTGVDMAVASAGEEEFGGLRVEVILIEGGRAFTLITGDCIWEDGGAAGLV